MSNQWSKVPLHRPSREPNSSMSLRDRLVAGCAAALRRRKKSAQSYHLPHEKLLLLPTTAKEFHKDGDDDDDDDDGHNKVYGWNITLQTILAGTRSSSPNKNNNNDNNGDGSNKDCFSPLSLLRDHETTIVRNIYGFIFNEYAKHVKLTIPAALVGNAHDRCIVKFSKQQGDENDEFRGENETDLPLVSSGFNNGYVAFSTCGYVEFPEPADRNVNMMPFILGDIDSLPEDLKCYYPLIERCQYMKEEIGKVAYLTVQESFVTRGETQRRPGLHIESPGFFRDNDGDPSNNNAEASLYPASAHGWGLGLYLGPDRYEGGIYFASNVSNSSMVWDALVDSTVPGIVDKHGGCEHLRDIIGEGTNLEAGQLVWMTDCTPHEALVHKKKKGCRRQFFRLVMPYVTHWYADHSTVNPMVAIPEHVKVMYGSKFDQ